MSCRAAYLDYDDDRDVITCVTLSDTHTWLLTRGQSKFRAPPASGVPLGSPG